MLGTMETTKKEARAKVACDPSAGMSATFPNERGDVVPDEGSDAVEVHGQGEDVEQRMDAGAGQGERDCGPHNAVHRLLALKLRQEAHSAPSPAVEVSRDPEHDPDAKHGRDALGEGAEKSGGVHGSGRAALGWLGARRSGEVNQLLAQLPVGAAAVLDLVDRGLANTNRLADFGLGETASYEGFDCFGRGHACRLCL